MPETPPDARLRVTNNKTAALRKPNADPGFVGAESPKPGLRARKKEKTRLILMRCALELIEEKGYEPTTVDEIVERADYSRSTFFRYFSTKEDVLLGGREQRIAHLAETLDGVDRTLSRPDAFSAVRQLLTQDTLELTEFAPELESACMRIAQSELLPGFALGLLRTERIVAKFLSNYGMPGPYNDFESRIMATAMIGVVRATLTSYLDDQPGVATRLKHGFDLLESRFQQTLNRESTDSFFAEST